MACGFRANRPGGVTGSCCRPKSAQLQASIQLEIELNYLEIELNFRKAHLVHIQ
jgi:hypothetical protein